MAKIRLGQLAGQVSGSIGSTTYSRNRYGTYTRLRSKPVQPTTLFNDFAKAAMSQATKIWQGLSDADQQAWRTFALTHPITDRLGDKQILDGHTACTQLNLNILYCQATPITVPPAVAAPNSLTTLSIAVDTTPGTAVLTFTPTPIGANNKLWVWAAVVGSPGVQYIKNLYRLAHVTSANVATGADVYSQLVTRFGTLQVGQVVWIRCFIVDQDTGLKSGGFTANTIVT